MYVLQATVIFVFGAIIGSFLNACIYRLPRGLSIVYPPSKCFSCEARLGLFDLFPLLSYIGLKGKCRHCGRSIPVRYFVVEILTAFAFLVLFMKYGLGSELFIMSSLSALMIFISSVDIEHQIIPDSANLAVLVLGFVFWLLKGEVATPVFGMLLGVLIMYLIYKLGSALYKREAMGGGDIKMAGAMGAVLGWQNLLLCIFSGYISAAIFSIALLVLKKKDRADEIVFGPFLAFGFFVAVFFSGWIWEWYLGI